MRNPSDVLAVENESDIITSGMCSSDSVDETYLYSNIYKIGFCPHYIWLRNANGAIGGKVIKKDYLSPMLSWFSLVSRNNIKITMFTWIDFFPQTFPFSWCAVYLTEL